MNDFKDKLLKEIHDGKVAMTPRAYFTLRMAALIGVLLAIVAVTIFIFNFIFFSIRVSSEEVLLFFGPRGWGAFLAFFPWPLLIADVALIALLQRLLRNFRFGYSVPILYLVAGLIVFAGVVGFALDRGTPLNDRLHDRRGDLPRPIGGFYEGARKPPPRGEGICRCTILAIEGNMLTLEDTRGATTTLKVILPLEDRRATTTGLKIGDVVFVAGKEKDGIIEAYGVRKEYEHDRPRMWHEPRP
ncbi:MAG: hypothetical protein WAZ27_03960 [Minisyncoccia bacterium]